MVPGSGSGGGPKTLQGASAAGTAVQAKPAGAVQPKQGELEALRVEMEALKAELRKQRATPSLGVREGREPLWICPNCSHRRN